MAQAHRQSSNHRPEIERSEHCGCFHCCSVFVSAEINEWINEPQGGETALCPICGIDSVIGSASGVPLTPEFLRALHARWF